MNISQQRYAMARIDDAMKEKLDALKEKCTKPAKEASDKEKIEAIRNGDAELKWNISLKAPLGSAFNFSGVNRAPVLDQAAYKEGSRKIREESAKAKDEIMLGDTKKAIQLIRQFCK